MHFALLSALVSAEQTRSWSEAQSLAKAAVSKLSVEQKVALVSGMGWATGPCVGNIVNPGGIGGFNGLCLQDSPTGVRYAYNVSAFAASINVAATFDKNLMLDNGRLMGQEFRGKGANVALAPMMNIGRAPAGGRNWEGQGADAFLAATSAKLQVKGIQEQGVIATAKHYVGNEQEVSRQSSSSNMDSRTFHEVYLKPFRACVEEGVGAIMCSYNLVNNTYACENDYTINTVLKGELGFKGFVMTDWWATAKLKEPISAGTDMMMPGSVAWGSTELTWDKNLVNAVKANQIPEARLDDMATRVLSSWYKVGQDKGFPAVNFDSFRPQQSQDVNVQADHKKHIRHVGAASSILLKNNGVLPLGKNLNIGILGSDAGPGRTTSNAADCPDHGCSDGTIAQGWGSGTTNFPYIVTPLDGVSARAAKDKSKVSSMLNDWDLQAAGALAAKSDVVLAFVSSDSGENYITVDGNAGDRNNLTLWHNGDNLINAAAANNKKVVVVIHSPGAVDMPWINNPNVAAVVLALFPGQESGNAIADVLFGDINPSGRLPFSINKDDSTYSASILFNTTAPAGFQYPQVNYEEGLFIDYKWNDAKGIEPLFPFGYGLSYTNFTYSNFAVKRDENNVKVSLAVANTGARIGNEVVQLYLGFPQSANEPPKQLKAFEKVLVPKSESKSVTLSMSTHEMRIWDVVGQKWTTPKGEYTLFVGASSRDIRWSTTFTV
ncbi:hypothetical protein HK103_000390 [Boothiomyces macroporosus]|uniref:beta-glucosidase n=1 Tax=Boothiomyces macroporosus TaxID=261099 RepID=A0AAD5UCH3_9FUNG|nr:hypothetical protein HK103_000390 [Boothiomyces macroporosus]